VAQQSGGSGWQRFLWVKELSTIPRSHIVGFLRLKPLWVLRESAWIFLLGKNDSDMLWPMGTEKTLVGGICHSQSVVRGDAPMV